jgi:hypothetical protein
MARYSTGLSKTDGKQEADMWLLRLLQRTHEDIRGKKCCLPAGQLHNKQHSASQQLQDSSQCNQLAARNCAWWKAEHSCCYVCTYTDRNLKRCVYACSRMWCPRTSELLTIVDAPRRTARPQGGTAPYKRHSMLLNIEPSPGLVLVLSWLRTTCLCINHTASAVAANSTTCGWATIQCWNSAQAWDA